VEEYGLPDYDAGQLTQSSALATYFEATVRAGAPPKLASNWIMGEFARVINERGVEVDRAPVDPGRLAGLIALVEKGIVSGSIAKAVFEKMLDTGESADDIVALEGLTQIDDDAQILGAIADVLARNGDAVAQYRRGKTASLGFLVGQVMKATAGKANPKMVNELLRRAIGSTGGVK
jgi:aspartyl-tRNA(Asn)/glutamyl-tRNA(Gln) amidotransferase subunit B